ncbi:hypothetical protein ACFE04_022159 [Oxalis oulophora]
MLNRFQWRQASTHLNSTTTHFFLSSRFLSQHLNNDDDDPPFSPLSSTTQNNPKTPLQVQLQNTNHLHFDFRYSYSETNPDVEPIGYREKKRFSPFGPGRLDRDWTGTAAPAKLVVEMESVEQERRRVLGEPLLVKEIEELVEKYRHSDCSRQINMDQRGSLLEEEEAALFGYLVIQVEWMCGFECVCGTKGTIF